MMSVIEDLKNRLAETNRNIAASLELSLKESTKESLVAIDELNRATLKLKATVQRLREEYDVPDR